jgi:hypothetical protein
MIYSHKFLIPLISPFLFIYQSPIKKILIYKKTPLSMALVTVYDRCNTMHFQTEYSLTDTILDIKRRISGFDPDSIVFSYNGKLINDSTPLKVLGENIVLLLEQRKAHSNTASRQINFICDQNVSADTTLGDRIIFSEALQSEEQDIPSICKDNEAADECEVEVNEIQRDLEADKESCQVNVIIDGKIRKVEPSDILIKNGKRYLITKRIKKITLEDCVKFIKRNLTPTQAIYTVLLAFILYTNNFYLFFIICSIKVLRLISKICVSLKIWEITKESHFCRAILMFFASLFILDHSKFYTEN